jgi:conjugal transfer pilus assembly protein TraA
MLTLQVPSQKPSVLYADIALIGAAALLLFASGAMAGTDTTFAAAVTWLNTSLTGTLGKTFALGSLAVGLGVGIVKQSVMSVAIGVGMALVASVGPGVLQGMFSAAI